MQKITHGKGNTFDSIPRVHGYPATALIDRAEQATSKMMKEIIRISMFLFFMVAV